VVPLFLEYVWTSVYNLFASLRVVEVWRKTNTGPRFFSIKTFGQGGDPGFQLRFDCIGLSGFLRSMKSTSDFFQDQRKVSRGNGALVLRFALPSLPASYCPNRRVLSASPPNNAPSFSGVGADAFPKRLHPRAREYSAAGLLSESGPLLRAARSPRFVDLQGLVLYCATRASRSRGPCS